ncbi:MAG: hypothetical protein ACREJB_00805, partial [Planctomycetaceae bacterium]
ISTGAAVPELHPIDERRKEYLKSLGAALREHPPSAEAIHDVEAFAVPYDPLVSHFLHFEVARLYARTDGRDAEMELAHRLHACFFADSRDRSVRDVTAVIELLCGFPQAEPDAAARWDNLNALLQLLKTRWEVRAMYEPDRPDVVLNDIEQSLSAAESAFAAMDDLYESAGVSETQWSARKEYIERGLVRPLRTYRTRLRPHHLKKLRLEQKRREEAKPGLACP